MCKPASPGARALSHRAQAILTGERKCAISVAIWKSVPVFAKSRSERPMQRSKAWSINCNESAMREYLAWEIDLVNQMAQDDDQRFRVVAG